MEHEDDAPPPPPPPPDAALLAFSDSDDDDGDGDEEPPPPPAAFVQQAAMAAAAAAAAAQATESPAAASARLEGEEQQLQRMLQAAAVSPRAPHPVAIKPPPSLESVRSARSVSLTPAEQKKHDALNPRVAAPEPMPPVRRLLLEGMLAKKSPKSFLTIWQDRWTVLYSDKLEYWKSRDECKQAEAKGKQPKGLIPLYSIKLVRGLAASKGKATRFDVVIGDGGNERTFELQAATAGEAENWQATIKQAIGELERSGAASVTGVMAGSGASSGGDDKKFWKKTLHIEQILTAPLPVTVTSSAATPKPSVSAAPAAAAPAPAPATKQTVTAAVAPATPVTSATSIEASSSSSSVAVAKSVPAAAESLPLDLQLIKAMSKSAQGSVYLAKERGASNPASSFFLVHLIRNSQTDGQRGAQLLRGMGALSSPFLPQQLFAGSCSDAQFAVYTPAVRLHDSLLTCLQQHRRMPEAVVQRIGAQLVCLLGHLHDAELVARSLCPDNLYFDGDGRVLLVDFNLAATTIGASSSSSLAEEEADALVPEYLTPEQCGGGRESRVSDYWRLGVLLYELSVGIPPFRASASASASAQSDPAAARRAKRDEIATKLAAHVAAELRFPPFVSAELQALIRALLAPNPSERLGASPSDAREVRAHPYWAAEDWERIAAGVEATPESCGGAAAAAAAAAQAAWIREKVLAPVPNAAAVAAANPTASAEQLEHMCLSPPPRNTFAVQPRAKQVLHVRVLGAQGLPPDSGAGGFAVGATCPSLGEGRKTRVGVESPGPNVSFAAGSCSFAFDFSGSGTSQAQAGEVVVELQSLASGGGVAAAYSLAIPVHSLSCTMKVVPRSSACLAAAATDDVKGADLERLVAECLAGDAAHAPQPASYALLSAQGMVQGEVIVQAVWVELRIPPRAAAAEPRRFALQTTAAATFGSCDGDGAEEEDEAEAEAVKELPMEVTAKFHTPGTRGRGSVFGSLPGRSGSVAPLGPMIAPLDLGRTTPPPPEPDANSAAAAEDEDEDDEDDEDESESRPVLSPGGGGASASAAHTGAQGGAVGVLRGLVSKKKLRYQSGGFDLDLSYITPRVIAMGFPADGAEAVYRNPMEQVQKFFAARHAGRFKIYNLCSERQYDHVKFGGSCVQVPFNDHNAPAFSLMLDFCRDAHDFLAKHPDNVIAVHCKAGKGRTGTMIAALLLFEQHCHSAEEALRFFGTRRTKNGAGVTIPSQRRYVAYFAQHLQRYRGAAGLLPASMPASPPAVTLRLRHIRFHTVPNFDVGGGCDPYFKVVGPPPANETLYDYRKALKAAGQSVQGCHDKRAFIDLAIPDSDAASPLRGCLLSGDVKFCFYDEDSVGGDDPMFHCWLHTAFIDPATRHVTLTKAQCDKAVKDKKCAKFDRDFKVEFWFNVPVEVAPGSSGEKDGMLVAVPLGRTTPPPPMPQELVDDDDDDDEDDDDESEALSPGASSVAAGASAHTGAQGGAVGVLRGLVSKKKLRYQSGGFDLDLSYITPRVIAMGFPADGAEAVYRNPMEQVQKFFAARHAGRFKIYNLCSERKYEHSKLDHSVCDIPFNDHNAPAFPLLMQFCRDAHHFLSQHPDNVIAVHCKAGKGRTGTMIAAFLLYEQHCISAQEALDFFGNRRTKNGAGVTIPSQRRYVHYFGEFLSRYRTGSSLSATIPSEPPRVALRLTRVLMHTVPNFDVGGGCDPYFKVVGPPPANETLYDYRKALKAHGQKVQSCHDKNAQQVELLVMGQGGRWTGGPCEPLSGCIVAGDFKLCFYDEDTFAGDDPMFHCWLHTAFIDPATRHVTLTKAQCDKAVKDKKCAHFAKDFTVELWFDSAQL